MFGSHCTLLRPRSKAKPSLFSTTILPKSFSQCFIDASSGDDGMWYRDLCVTVILYITLLAAFLHLSSIPTLLDSGDVLVLIILLHISIPISSRSLFVLDQALLLVVGQNEQKIRMTMLQYSVSTRLWGQAVSQLADRQSHFKCQGISRPKNALTLFSFPLFLDNSSKNLVPEIHPRYFFLSYISTDHYIVAADGPRMCLKSYRSWDWLPDSSSSCFQGSTLFLRCQWWNASLFSISSQLALDFFLDSSCFQSLCLQSIFPSLLPFLPQ